MGYETPSEPTLAGMNDHLSTSRDSLPEILSTDPCVRTLHHQGLSIVDSSRLASPGSRRHLRTSARPDVASYNNHMTQDRPHVQTQTPLFQRQR